MVPSHQGITIVVATLFSEKHGAVRLEMSVSVPIPAKLKAGVISQAMLTY
jgi:hypothetical protein